MTRAENSTERGEHILTTAFALSGVSQFIFCPTFDEVLAAKGCPVKVRL
jgi:hypothetical protein